MKIKSGIAFMYEPIFLDAIEPLLRNEEIEALEWAFDTLIDMDQLPERHHAILNYFSHKNQLYGHGVFYSPMAAKWLPKQQNWIDKLDEYLQRYSFGHLSEHFAFMSSLDAHHGMPLPFYIGQEAIDITINRMRIFAEKTNLPVGLENLAFTFTPSEIARQADNMTRVLEAVNGFVVLDLHNIYCQAVNFDLSMESIIALYPLERVKEIHISGGSWSQTDYADRPVRRDSHDSSIPAEIFIELEKTILKTPNLDLVVMERNGHTFTSEKIAAEFRAEFLEMKKIVKAFDPTKNNYFKYPGVLEKTMPIDNLDLYNAQNQIMNLFESEASPEKFLQKMKASPQMSSAFHPNEWSLGMADTAIQALGAWGVKGEKV